MNRILIESVSRLDLFVWILVIFFFCGSSLLFAGNLQYSFLGACGIILEMLLISISIEIIIDALKNTKGIGTLTGFITNGPEALCLLVGLFVGDIIFAASTPLGSNFMNPILLVCAALVCSCLGALLRCSPFYTATTIILTATLAVVFFFIPTSFYLYWLTVVILVTLLLFFLRPKEPHNEEPEEEAGSKLLLLPAILILTIAGYFLDSVVSFAAIHSHAPKGIIGFLVLATLTSWPEFKSCIALLQRKMILSAILNITVSNITNLWLAALGLITYLIVN